MITSGKMTKRLIIILSVALSIAVILCIVLGVRLHSAYKYKSICEWDMIPVSEAQLSSVSDYNPDFMTLAIQNALDGMAAHKGGPIGAVIVKDGKIIASASNENRLTGYGFFHAEMCAIRDAIDALGTNDLSGCQLYTSAQPCIMCESAIAGADIEKIYYAATLSDMQEYGYDDIGEYETIHSGKNLVPSVAVQRKDKLEPLEVRKRSRQTVKEKIQQNKSQSEIVIH